MSEVLQVAGAGVTTSVPLLLPASDAPPPPAVPRSGQGGGEGKGHNIVEHCSDRPAAPLLLPSPGTQPPNLRHFDDTITLKNISIQI